MIDHCSYCGNEVSGEKCLACGKERITADEERARELARTIYSRLVYGRQSATAFDKEDEREIGRIGRAIAAYAAAERKGLGTCDGHDGIAGRHSTEGRLHRQNIHCINWKPHDCEAAEREVASLTDKVKELEQKEELARRTCNDNYDWAKRVEREVARLRELLKRRIDGPGFTYAEYQKWETEARAALGEK